MRRVVGVFLAMTVAFVIAPSPANSAGGADIVGGSAQYLAGGGLVTVDFTSGAQDKTPGVYLDPSTGLVTSGLDGQGTVILSMKGVTLSGTTYDFVAKGRVLCVKAVGNTAGIAARVTQSSGTLPTFSDYICVYVTDGGRNSVDLVQAGTGSAATDQNAEVTNCSFFQGGTFPVTQGNIVVRDGAPTVAF